MENATNLKMLRVLNSCTTFHVSQFIGLFDRNFTRENQILFFRKFSHVSTLLSTFQFQVTRSTRSNKYASGSFLHGHGHGHGHGHDFLMGSVEVYDHVKQEFIMANWSVLGSIILPNVGGWASGYYFAKQIRGKTPGEKTWYDEINKPSWNPPNWVFGPTWTVLYSSMGYASYLVWEECGGFTESAIVPLTLYGTQLALNWSWTPIFFGLKDFKLALIEIAVLDAAAVATALSFGRVRRAAGLLLAPYVAWLALASALNYWIWKNNPKAPGAGAGATVTEIKDQ